MKTLHILKTKPDSNTKTLISSFDESEGVQGSVFELFKEEADYEKLIDLIFENDRTFSWW